MIDAGDSPETLRELVKFAKIDELAAVITTHGHRDHWQALNEIANHYQAVTLIGEYDANLLPFPVNVHLAHGQILSYANIHLQVIHLRGHTPGSISLTLGASENNLGSADAIFTGDSLFPDGLGATGNDLNRFEQLFADVKEKIFDKFSDETLILPGHGPYTCIGDERSKLPIWYERKW